MPDTKDLQWLVVNTRPHQERKVREILMEEQRVRPNLLEVYCPSHPVVRVQHGNRELQQPLFAGKVFVLSTQETATAVLADRYPEGYLEYDKTQHCVMVIPERQMLFFQDFNEHYPERVIVLERPYSDYAFNAKNDAPNEAVMVLDGPFKGKTGYLLKFRNQRRLVFQMQDIAVSLPDAWDYHLTRLHNSDDDRQTRATLTARIADSIVGTLQGCGFVDEAPEMLSWLLQTLAEKQTFAALREALTQRYDREETRQLDQALATLTPDAAADWLALANYTLSHPDFLNTQHEAAIVRPFLTPTATPASAEGDTVVEHQAFTEIIRKVSFTEPTFYPALDEGRDNTVTYYAHVGVLRKDNGKTVLLTNFHPLLREYFLLGGEAKERQLATFRQYCPTLHRVLMGESDVKIGRQLALGTTTIDTLALQAEATGAALQTLIDASRQICQEINSSTHLAIWRRYLRAVWLHQ